MNKNKPAIYPLNAWEVTEECFDIKTNYRNETTFALSNGYIGTRGTMEEAYNFDVDTGMEGNFINGFYESTDIRYGEANFGSPLRSQTFVSFILGRFSKVWLRSGEPKFASPYLMSVLS